MASTRSWLQPLQIYQDPIENIASQPVQHASRNQKTSSPLRPIKNAASRRNIMLKPPQAGFSKQSPAKSLLQALSSSPSRVALGSSLKNISMPPPSERACTTDSMEKKQPLMSKFKPQKALFTTFLSARPMGKENYQQPICPAPAKQPYHGISGSNFSLEGLYGQKAPFKRTLLEAAAIQESRERPAEGAQEREDGLGSQDLPHPESFPALHDDGTKPPHSYAQLIGMSILRAPNRRLTLAQIYKWISDTYSFYGANDAGWQNSIRHNLSLNKAFIKQERPKDDPGKGNYWAIEPGMEHQYIKEKPCRKSAGMSDSIPVMAANLAPAFQGEPSHQFYKPLTPTVQELPPRPSYPLPKPQPPSVLAPSSDATIPASDEVGVEQAVARQEVPSSPLIRSSPPPGMMHSSPPIPCHSQRRHNTPPPVPRFPSSSRTRSHKRKFASMDDSGYFSSLDSSAKRGLNSESDHPRLKRGRAEEEIARLRGSSYDSPTRRTSFGPASSSPLRRAVTGNNSLMLPPVTPLVKLKAPRRPPPSASPNTNLRLHREKVRTLVGSPLRGVAILDESTPWSPAFDLGHENTLQCQDAEFDIFSTFLSLPPAQSPEKRSLKKPRLDRSRSANILADITNSVSKKSNTSTPTVGFMAALDPLMFESPSKGLGFMESPCKLLGLSPTKDAAEFLDTFSATPDEFFGTDFLVDDLDEFSGMDIMQGFQKIGAGRRSGRNTPNAGAARPALGRSCSTPS